MGVLFKDKNVTESLNILLAIFYYCWLMIKSDFSKNIKYVTKFKI